MIRGYKYTVTRQYTCILFHRRKKNGTIPILMRYTKEWTFEVRKTEISWKCELIYFCEMLCYCLDRTVRVFVQLVNCHFNANDVCWSLVSWVLFLRMFEIWSCLHLYQHQSDAKEPQRPRIASWCSDAKSSVHTIYHNWISTKNIQIQWIDHGNIQCPMCFSCPTSICSLPFFALNSIKSTKPDQIKYTFWHPYNSLGKYSKIFSFGEMSHAVVL